METKVCPYCGETIMANAKKCRYCGEWLENAPTTPATPTPQAPAPPVAPQQHDDAPVMPDPVPDYEEKGPAVGFFRKYFIDSYLRPYAKFSGYTSRKEFWMTYLAMMILSIGVCGLGLLVMGLGGMRGCIISIAIYGLLSLATVLPGLAIVCRRLRDAGKSPWMILLALIPFVGSIIVLVLLCLPSQYEHNESDCKFGVTDIIITALCPVLLGVGGWMYAKSLSGGFDFPSSSHHSTDLYNFSDDDYDSEAPLEVAIPSVDDDYSWASETYVSDNLLSDMTPTELRLARNSIYARHGYIFKSEDLREYFSRFDWYEPRYTDVTSQLTDLELHNIEKIKQHE